MCQFESLYYGDDGFVIRCKQCGHYRVAFISTMLNLTENNFQALRKVVQHKCIEADYSYAENNKSIIIETALDGVYIMLTSSEVKRFNYILEEADNEVKALSLISLFNQ